VSRWPYTILPPSAHFENVFQIGVERQITGRRLLAQGHLIEIRHRGVHLFHSNVSSSARPQGISLAELASHPVHVEQFVHGGPAFVTLAPARSGSEPHGK